MEFDSDPVKAKTNLNKHGISFAEAESVFYDPFAQIFEDPNAFGEYRYITIGMSDKTRLLIVVSTYRDDAVRIISAWKANNSQKVIYENEKRSY